VSQTTSIFRVRKDATKPFAAVWTSHMLVELFLLMPSALLPVFGAEFGLSIFQAGLLITVPNLCRLTITIPTGIFADKYGPRPLLILSMGVAGISALFLSQSTNALMLLFLLCALSISVTLYHSPGMSSISKLFPEQSERSSAVGLHGASGCLGQAVGTISLGLLLVSFGWRFPYLVFSIPLLAWTIILSRLRIPQFAKRIQTKRNPDSQASDQTKQSSLLTVSFMMLLFSMGLNALANNGALAFTTTFFTTSKHLSAETATIVFGVGPLIGIVGSLLAGYVAARLGDKNTLVLIYLGQIVFLLSMIVVPAIEFAALSYLIYQMFSAALWTPSTSMVASLTQNGGGGKAYSLFYLAGDTLGAIAPTIAAILIGVFGILSPFILAIALFACSGMIVKLMKQT
jgi:MFS family permease